MPFVDHVLGLVEEKAWGWGGYNRVSSTCYTQTEAKQGVSLNQKDPLLCYEPLKTWTLVILVTTMPSMLPGTW